MSYFLSLDATTGWEEARAAFYPAILCHGCKSNYSVLILSGVTSTVQLIKVEFLLLIRKSKRAGSYTEVGRVEKICLEYYIRRNMREDP